MSRFPGRLLLSLGLVTWTLPWTAVPAERGSVAAVDSIPGTPWTLGDWKVLDEKIRWAAGRRLDTLELGDAIAAMGSRFVGATYRPGTLEAPGPERRRHTTDGSILVVAIRMVRTRCLATDGHGDFRSAEGTMYLLKELTR